MRADLPVPTTIGDVVPALVEALSAIPDVFVQDGAGVSQPGKYDTIFVAISDNGGEAIRHQQISDGRLDDGVSEAYDIVCSAGSYRGAGSLADRRNRLVEMLGAVQQALEEAEDRDGALGGTCDTARIGTRLSWRPAPGGAGFSYTVGFTIAVTASVA